MRSARLACAVAGACSLLFVSCATTRKVQTWKDGSYQGKIKKTVVMAGLSEPLRRNFLEMEFVVQFKARGVEAVAGNKTISAELARDKQAALAFVKGQGIGTVLVVKIVDQRYSDQARGGGVGYVPTGYAVGWDGIYEDGFMAVGLPVSQSSMDVFGVQLNVYDVQEAKLIYSAVSTTYIEGAKEKVIRPYVETMIKELSAAGLL